MHSTLTVIATKGIQNNSNSESTRSQAYNNIKSNEIVAINFVTFGEKALLILANLYEESASHESVIENSILKSIIQVKKLQSLAL